MRRAAIAITIACCLLAGCGIPVDDAPRQIDPERVPFELLEPDTTTTSTVATSTQVSAEIFLVRDDRLAAVTRDVSAPVTPQRLVAALLRGPTNVEAGANLRTAITTMSGIIAFGPDAGLVRVELGRAFATSGASDQVLAFAQLVYTVTSVPGASLVAFTVSGRAVEAPAGDGTLKGDPLGRADYPTLAP